MGLGSLLRYRSLSSPTVSSHGSASLPRRPVPSSPVHRHPSPSTLFHLLILHFITAIPLLSPLTFLTSTLFSTLPLLSSPCHLSIRPSFLVHAFRIFKVLLTSRACLFHLNISRLSHLINARPIPPYRLATSQLNFAFASISSETTSIRLPCKPNALGCDSILNNFQPNLCPVYPREIEASLSCCLPLLSLDPTTYLPTYQFRLEPDTPFISHFVDRTLVLLVFIEYDPPPAIRLQPSVT